MYRLYKVSFNDGTTEKWIVQHRDGQKMTSVLSEIEWKEEWEIKKEGEALYPEDKEMAERQAAIAMETARKITGITYLEEAKVSFLE